MPDQPPELAWQKFLELERWTDSRVQGAQPDCVIYERWVIFCIRLAWGDLPGVGSSPF